jgi:hypothetical protein
VVDHRRDLCPGRQEPGDYRALPRQLRRGGLDSSPGDDVGLDPLCLGEYSFMVVLSLLVVFYQHFNDHLVVFYQRFNDRLTAFCSSYFLGQSPRGGVASRMCRGGAAVCGPLVQKSSKTMVRFNFYRRFQLSNPVLFLVKIS